MPLLLGNSLFCQTSPTVPDTAQMSYQFVSFICICAHLQQNTGQHKKKGLKKVFVQFIGTPPLSTVIKRDTSKQNPHSAASVAFANLFLGFPVRASFGDKPQFGTSGALATCYSSLDQYFLLPFWPQRLSPNSLYGECCRLGISLGFHRRSGPLFFVLQQLFLGLSVYI